VIREAQVIIGTQVQDFGRLTIGPDLDRGLLRSGDLSFGLE
jgi:hypothetical protein